MDLGDILADAQKRIVSDSVYQEYEKNELKNRIAKFHEKSGIDTKYINANINSTVFSEDHRNVLKSYVDKIRGIKDYPRKCSGDFLIILGEVGTGKTYSACAVMNELLEGQYYDMPELRLKLNTVDRFNASETRESFLHKLAKCNLLVLDEIGRFPIKQDEEKEVLFYLINKRYANNLPTILCSNLDPKEFSEYVGQAVIDRLKNKNTKLILNGKSKRETL